MHTPNLADTRTVAQAIKQALLDGRTVELSAVDRRTLTIRRYTAGHCLVSSPDGNSYTVPFVWLAREIDSLRNYGYLTTSNVRIVG